MADCILGCFRGGLLSSPVRNTSSGSISACEEIQLPLMLPGAAGACPDRGASSPVKSLGELFVILRKVLVLVLPCESRAAAEGKVFRRARGKTAKAQGEVFTAGRRGEGERESPT